MANKLLLKYAAAFTAFFLFPLLILSFSLQFILYHNLEQDVLDHNTKVVQYLSQGFGELHSSLMATCNEISFDPSLRRDLDTAENKIDVLSLLSEKSQSNPYISKIYLLADYGRYCFSSSGYYSMDRLLHDQMSIAQSETESFQTHLFSTNTPLYDSYDREYLLKNISFSKQIVIFTYPVSNYGHSSDSWLIIEINSNRLRDMGTLGAGEYSDGVYMITDGGNVLYSYDDRAGTETVDMGKWGQAFGERLKTGSTAFLYTGNGQKAIIWPIAKTNMGLVNIVRSPQFLKDVARNNTSLFIGILILLIAGCVLAGYAAVRYYRPIHQLSEYVSPEMNDTILQDDDLEQIRMQYDRLHDRNTALVKELEQQWPLAEERLASELLYSGRFDIEVTDMMGSILAGEMRDLYFTVAVVMGDGEASPELLKMHKEKRLDTTHATEELPFMMDTYLYQYNAIFVIIGSAYKPDAALRKAVKRLIKDFYRTDSDFLSIHLGGAYSSYRGIRLSFLESITLAFEEQSSTVEEESFLQEHEMDYDTQSISFQTENILKINRCIATGNTEDLPGIVHDIVLDLMDLQKYIRRMYCFDIINNIVKEAQKKSLHVDAASLCSLTTEQTPSVFGEKLQEMLEYVCREVTDNCRKTQLDLTDRLLNYIEKHYRNPNLSLVSMSDDLGLSPSYLSRFMSKNLDSGFNEMITHKRMEYAKESLVHTDKPIGQIVSETGYFNISNFMRRFKSLEGRTPGQYRSRYRVPQEYSRK
ncbi:AraC family transcriptional regulator [Marispirochaeta sp.]|uniref:helix-turn-helix transcriptional regulator n=1 Tax=Marispirochaeta sp. TaxID=2038653 RepID=UPI0029C6D6BE|nr:AraC family transcriptional regulator [Marispirochaeta sp.]